MQEATELAHAVLSASGFKRWSTCTMSAAVEAGIEEEDSDFAAEGTFAHSLAEVLTRVWLSGNDGADIYDATAIIESEEGQRWYTQEMQDFVDEYVKFVIDAVTLLQEQHGHENVIVLLEQRLDFSRWVPEGFGTGDCVIVYPGGVWVIDLKYGAGVLVKDTGQLRLYGLGAFNRYDPIYEIEQVTVSIVQPRKQNIVTESLTKDEILTWAEELVVPRAKIAWAAYKGDRSQARFSPGQHCSDGFCKARFRCAARARYMLEAAEQPFANNAPDLLTVEQLEQVVDRSRLAVKWLSDCERHLTELAQEGKVTLQRHRLAPGRTIRQITDTTAAAQKLMENGFAAGDIYEPPRLRGLGALEGLVGAKQFTEIMGDLLDKPTGRPTLVPIEEAPRVSRKAARASDEFDQYGDE